MWTEIEDSYAGIVFGGGDPQPVLGLHRDLAGDVGAAVGLVRRQPGGGVAVALLPVGGRVDRQQVQRVVGQARAACAATQRCAPFCQASPSATTWSMSTCDALAADEGDRCRRCTGRRSVPLQDARSRRVRLDLAAVRSRRRMSLRVSQPLRSVSVQAGPNCVPGVAGHRRAALDGERREQRERGVGAGRASCFAGLGGRRSWGLGTWQCSTELQVSPGVVDEAWSRRDARQPAPTTTISRRLRARWPRSWAKQPGSERGCLASSGRAMTSHNIPSCVSPVSPQSTRL